MVIRTGDMLQVKGMALRAFSGGLATKTDFMWVTPVTPEAWAWVTKITVTPALRTPFSKSGTVEI